MRWSITKESDKWRVRFLLSRHDPAQDNPAPLAQYWHSSEPLAREAFAEFLFANLRDGDRIPYRGQTWEVLKLTNTGAWCLGERQPKQIPWCNLFDESLQLSAAA